MRHVSDISDVSIISDISDVSGGRLVETVAAFIRTRRSADRGDLLAEILRLWPDLTGQELQAAINQVRRHPLLVLAAEPDRRRA